MSRSIFKPVQNFLEPEPAAGLLENSDMRALTGLAALLAACCLFMAYGAWRFSVSRSKSPHVVDESAVELMPLVVGVKPEGPTTLPVKSVRAPSPYGEDRVGAWTIKTNAYSSKSLRESEESRGMRKVGLVGGATASVSITTQSSRPAAPRPAFKAVANFMSASEFTGSEFQPFKRRGVASIAESASGAAASEAGSVAPESVHGRERPLSAQAVQALGMAGAVQGKLSAAAAQGLLPAGLAQLRSAQEASLTSVEYAAKVTHQAAQAVPYSSDAQLAAQYMDNAVESARAGDFRSADAYEQSAKLLLQSAAAEKAAREQK